MENKNRTDNSGIIRAGRNTHYILTLACGVLIVLSSNPATWISDTGRAVDIFLTIKGMWHTAITSAIEESMSENRDVLASCEPLIVRFDDPWDSTETTARLNSTCALAAYEYWDLEGPSDYRPWAFIHKGSVNPTFPPKTIPDFSMFSIVTRARIRVVSPTGTTVVIRREHTAKPARSALQQVHYDRLSSSGSDSIDLKLGPSPPGLTPSTQNGSYFLIGRTYSRLFAIPVRIASVGNTIDWKAAVGESSIVSEGSSIAGINNLIDRSQPTAIEGQLGPLSRLDIATLEEVVNTMESALDGGVNLGPISASRDVVAKWLGVPTFLPLMFLFFHFTEIRRRVSLQKDEWSEAWVAIYPGRLPRVFTSLSIVVLPAYAVWTFQPTGSFLLALVVLAAILCHTTVRLTARRLDATHRQTGS